MDQLNIEFENAATVLKLCCSSGCPDAPIKGEKVLPPSVLPEGVSMYYGDSTAEGLILGGSRALAFIAPSLGKTAEKLVRQALGPCFSPEKT